MFTILSMSEFEELYNDQVTVINDASAEAGPFRCIFNQKEGVITFFREMLPWKPSRVCKILPNGERDLYDVLDVEHHQAHAFMERPAKVVLRVKRWGKQDTSGQFNLSGALTITNSTGVQVGLGNSQDVVQNLVDIASLVQNGTLPAEQKAEALGLLQSFLRHPAVVDVIGGVATAAADRMIRN
jgi:hypothetical protein